jgi:hypothetical protein
MRAAAFVEAITLAARTIRRAERAAAASFFTDELQRHASALTARAASLHERQDRLTARVDKLLRDYAGPVRKWYSGEGERTDVNAVYEQLGEQWTDDDVGSRVVKRVGELAEDLQVVSRMLEEFVAEEAARVAAAQE